MENVDSYEVHTGGLHFYSLIILF